MSSVVSEIVPVAEVDYLDEDTPIRGQNFACLSFISPEDVLANKEVFVFSKFIKSFSKDLDELLTGIKAKYPDEAGNVDVIRENHEFLFNGDEMQEQYKFFKEVHGSAMDKEFHEANQFKTSVRGIKVRGVFDSLKEAQIRAEFLKRKGDKFDIYVSQVGCWCPWSPNPHDMDDQTYAETQLNTIMSKYKQNMEHRDEVYEKRKDNKIKDAKMNIANARQKASEAAIPVVPDITSLSIGESSSSAPLDPPDATPDSVA